jgi:cell division septal protein FtsQ
MKKWFTFTLVVGLAAAMAAAMARIPEALAEVETFRVAEIRLKGARFLAKEDAEELLAIPPHASVWDDTSEWEARLASHPLVKKVKIHRRFPGTLLLDIEEAEPVALFPSPTLVPVDASGRILPIDPTLHRLDLPLIASSRGDGAGSLTQAERSLLASELSRLVRADPGFGGQISDITLDPGGDLRAQFLKPPVVFRFRPGLANRRIQDGLRVLADAAARFEEDAVANLDLRYEDQVVVRLDPIGGR